MFKANPLLQKTFNLIWIIFEKILNRKGPLGLNGWAGVMRERMPTTKKDESRAQSAGSSKA